MKLIYNPIEDRVDERGRTIAQGSDIKGWVYKYTKYNHPRGKILQYEDEVGLAILENYTFLHDLSKADAEKILSQERKKAFACKFCPKSFDVPIALQSHMRTHKDKAEEENRPVDEKLIPVAKGEKTQGADMIPGITPGVNSAETFDETSGPDFYGPGFTENKQV